MWSSQPSGKHIQFWHRFQTTVQLCRDSCGSYLWVPSSEEVSLLEIEDMAWVSLSNTLHFVLSI